MIVMKPSLPALRAFDAAAQHGSFRAAAEHLSVTATAISHHVRGLEDQLGTKLFVRSGRDVVLTEDGARLSEATVQAFGILDDAVRTLHRDSRKVVRLAVGPIFTARWLMPRISEFWQAHPNIELEFLPSFEPGAYANETIDIVIRWDRIEGSDPKAIKLLELSPAAIASKAFIETHPAICHPDDLKRLPLLHQRNHWGWLDWFTAMNVAVDSPLRGPIFQDANTLLRGAADGQGVVIGWLPLIDQDLADGRVVRLFDEDISPTHGYFVEMRGGLAHRAEVRRVVEWLTGGA